MGRRKKLIVVQESDQSLANEQSIDSSNEVNQEGSHVESHNSFGSTSESSNNGEKKIRGYTHMLDVWDMPDGEFVRVEVDHMGNPMGWEGKTLLNAIGSLVRRNQCAPINYLCWKDMSESYIANMMDLIKTTKARGVQPSQAQVYIDTRTQIDGSIVTEKAADVIDELKKQMTEVRSSENPQATLDSTYWKNDIYSKVKGPERR